MQALCVIPNWLETGVNVRLEVVPQKLNSWSGASQGLLVSEPLFAHQNGKQALEASLWLVE